MSAKRYSYEDAQAFIVEHFSRFSEAMGIFAQNAFEKNWIDPEPRKGKVGGAYDTSFPVAKESRILSNFDYTYSGVSTIAHELGHAYHDSKVMQHGGLLANYPMPLAETASIFCEGLIFRALEEADEEERIASSKRSFRTRRRYVWTSFPASTSRRRCSSAGRRGYHRKRAERNDARCPEAHLWSGT